MDLKEKDKLRKLLYEEGGKGWSARNSLAVDKTLSVLEEEAPDCYKKFIEIFIPIRTDMEVAILKAEDKLRKVAE
jgi:hypothetical protein